MKMRAGWGSGVRVRVVGMRQISSALAIRAVLVSMVFLAFGGAKAKAACNYYASPTGTGNGLSSSSPFQVYRFWNVATPGKTLCLLDGTYSGSNSIIRPPEGLNGASGLPITIRAVNEGKVLINGKGGATPIALKYNDWFVIEGVNACCSNSSVVNISRSNHNVVRRVAAWDAADNNTVIFAVNYDSSFNLFEDVAGWGTARKIFAVSAGGDYTTIRRAWGRWERSTVVGPKMTYSLAYNSYHLTCENCIGAWSGQGMPSSYVLKGYDGQPWTGNGAGTYTNYQANQPFGIFSVDRLDGDKNAHARLLGSLAYHQASDKSVAAPAVYIYGVDSIEIKDTGAYIAPGLLTSVKPFGLYSFTEPAVATNLYVTDVSGFGGASSLIQSQWKQSNVFAGTSPTAYGSGENIFNTSRGANLCYRYENGNLTSQPLWPWPMNQRIKDALVQSGRSSVDITATVQNIFGAIPAPCRAG